MRVAEVGDGEGDGTVAAPEFGDHRGGIHEPAESDFGAGEPVEHAPVDEGRGCPAGGVVEVFVSAAAAAAAFGADGAVVIVVLSRARGADGVVDVRHESGGRVAERVGYCLWPFESHGLGAGGLRRGVAGGRSRHGEGLLHVGVAGAICRQYRLEEHPSMHDLLDSPWIWQIGVRGVYSHTTLAMREGHEAADVEPPTYNDQPTSTTSAPSSSVSA